MFCTTLDEMRRAAVAWSREPVVALDTETSGLDPLSDRVLLVAFSNGDDALVCDVRDVPRDGLREALAPLLEGGPVKVMHHARFDLRMLDSLGLRVFPVADTLLNELVLDNGRPDQSHALAELSRRYLGVPLDKAEREGFARVAEGAFTPSQLEYAARDVLATYQVFLQQVPRLQREGARAVARLEALCVPAVAAMEQKGILLDEKAWRRALETAQRARDEARRALQVHLRPAADVDLLGELTLNLDSDAEVLPVLRRLGAGIDHIHNEALRESPHPAAAALLAYRETGKHVSTYGEGFLQYLHPADGRIHASFRQIGASSGRMSCERPNLQNIPKTAEMRSCIVAPPGRAIVTADYAACELRILAHMSQDPVFLRAFEHGEDVHAQVASQVFGVPVSKQQHPELRERAKAVSFGLIYGMGAAGLARATDLPLDDAEALMKRYFAQFPRIDAALRGLEQKARANGYASTVLGRRYYVDEKAWLEPGGRVARNARNMPIQGTSADITKLAMAFLHQKLQGTGAFLVNCIHDELLVECPRDDAERVGAIVKAEMERAMSTVVPHVPALAEVRFGDHWTK